MNAGALRCGYAFARNPIIVSGEWPGWANDLWGGSIKVYSGNTSVFEGRFYPPLRIDVSDIVDAVVAHYPEPGEDLTDPVVHLVDFDSEDGKAYRFEVEAEYDSLADSYSFIALPGGVSRQNFARYVNTGSDAFQVRFLNPKGNFFLTTRHPGWLLRIRETELEPLYFVGEQLEEIRIKDRLRGEIYEYTCGVNGVFALDPEKLRHYFFVNFGILVNSFDIYREGQHSCRLVIERCFPAKERVRIRFRNSFSVFETIDIRSAPSFKTSYEGGDQSEFNRVDTSTGYMIRSRERPDMRLTATVKVGPVRQDEVPFLLDMIGSEEVYLLETGRAPLKVLPVLDGIEYERRPDSPEIFSIGFTPVMDEGNVMEEIDSGLEFHSRVFSRQFTREFN